MPEHDLQALPSGHRMDEYEIVRVLGAGGFGITYLAFDHNLHAPVAIKEYFYSGLVTRTGGNRVVPSSASKAEGFEWGRARFLDEARLLARLDHPNVVRVRRCIEAHNTAYLVMDYVEGESLAAVLEKHGALTPPEWRRWLEPLLGGLQYVHRRDYLHRDVKPANVVIRAEDGAPVLIDFGSARRAAGEKTRHLTAVHTDGYAPIEQYSASSRQGPATDIYGLAAVSYRALTGKPPPAAPDRMLDDTCRPLADQAGGADRAWLAALDRGLALRPEDRPKTVAAWRAALASAGDAADRPPRRGGGAPGIPERPRETEAPSSSSQPRPSSRRDEYGLAAALLVMVGLAVAIGVVQQQRQEAEVRLAQQQAADAELRRRAAEAERRRQAAARQRPGYVFRDCEECPEVVVVPAGSFTMGSPSTEDGRLDSEGPQHRVTIGAPFAVGVYEVTFAEWDACVTNGGCGGYRPDDRGWGRGRRPVINVNWRDAQSYVRWLSRRTGQAYRLPSESEWEYAARAGTPTRYWWGDSVGRNRANCHRDGCGDTYSYTAPAGSFGANGFGLFDVSGNVWEWVRDCWRDDYRGAPTDGSARISSSGCRRVLRGGSWLYDPWLLRSARRFRYDAVDRGSDVGFRVAMTLFTPLPLAGVRGAEQTSR